MNGPPVISAEALGKRYRIGRRAAVYQSLREAVTASVRGAVGRAVRRLRTDPDDDVIWALRDCTFQVGAGEVLGIIGRNGAGKTTLLKILSRITDPTRGRVVMRGRVGSLLEVGTGFHPELTGRENIFLNGAILGMRRSEIRGKFDEIVDFAGIDRFLDTPVKRYSSGMYVRLAFSVAAHLEPEILLVDEVLAVGDAEFQRKCLGKMSEVSRAGRTVLFISHSMAAIGRLCDRALVLDGGRVLFGGDVDTAVRFYLKEVLRSGTAADLGDAIAALPADPDFRLLDVRISQHGQATTSLSSADPVRIEVDYEIRETLRGFRTYFDLCDERGDILIRSFHDERATSSSVMEPGRYTSAAELPAHILAPRRYTLVVRCTQHNVRSLTGAGVAVELDVEAAVPLNTAYPAPVVSKLQPPVAWRTRRLPQP